MVFAGDAEEDRKPSPSGKLFAHYTLCSMQNPCIPEVVITNRDGVESRRFEVRSAEGPCRSILDVQWAGENMIAALCHGTPSMNYYYEVELASGKVVREYLGLGFVRSPDDSKVAHSGWITHFAPLWNKSDSLQDGNTFLYPLLPGMKPVEETPSEGRPKVVRKRGLVYAGVHSFRSKLMWSADSLRIGLVDCIVDYRLREDSAAAFAEGGKEENLRCYAVAVGLDGTFRRTLILPGNYGDFQLKWIDIRTLRVARGGKSFEVKMP